MVVKKSTSNFFKILGIILAVKQGLRFLNFIYSNFIRRKRNLIERYRNDDIRYGQMSFVLITGSSQGIGKALALEMAKEGFNIILSARVESKLLAVQQQIEQKYPSVITRILIMDYSIVNEEYIHSKLNQIERLDISILINNVGVDVLEQYGKLHINQITRLISINCTSFSLLIHIFLRRFLLRKNKSALITISSTAAEHSLPYHNIYSGSKAFSHLLTKAIGYEYPQIDTLSVKPGEVSTAMIQFRPPDLLTISAPECAQSILRQIGHEKETYGHWRHAALGQLLKWVPQNFFFYIWSNFLAKKYMEGRRRM